MLQTVSIIVDGSIEDYPNNLWERKEGYLDASGEVSDTANEPQALLSIGD